MTDVMEQAHGLAETYEEAMAKFRASLVDTRRHWLAYTLTQYPHRDVLQVVAETARHTVNSDAVEINAIYDDRQVTVALSPDGPHATILAGDSLCALTVASGRPLAVDDIKHDHFLEHHSAPSTAWGSWASAPLTIQGHVVGSLCALERHERSWAVEDERVLTSLADELGAEIGRWIDSLDRR